MPRLATIQAVDADPNGRRADRARRRGRLRRVRDALPALRATRVRARAPPPRRPRPSRGRGPGDVRLGLALGSSYRPERGPGAPWLYAVARNAIVDGGARRRATGRARRRAAETPGPPSAPRRAGPRGGCTAPSASCRSSERQLIELAYWGGLSQSEIAEFLESRWERSRRGHGARSPGSPTYWKESSRERPPDFHDLVGDDLRPRSSARLERVHDLLIEAGPPPELPPSLAETPRPRRRRRGAHRAPPPPRGAASPSRPRSRCVAFLGGYLLGFNHTTSSLRPSSTAAITNTKAQAAGRSARASKRQNGR